MSQPDFVTTTPPPGAPASGRTVDPQPGAPGSASVLRQPTAVWAVAFACAVAFMGIGLVDPILPAISEKLHASPMQAMWLFTSYLFITGIAMFFTSAISSRLGAKRTLLIGLAIIVVMAACAGFSGNVNAILGFRAGWGLGNALFISTALAAIVGAASGGVDSAIMLYEAALGVGMACGPLLGGLLGSWSWRGPFFGTAVLMAVGFLAITALLQGREKPVPVSLTVTGQALRHPVLMTLAAAAMFYNYGFFGILAYSPFPLTHAGEAAGFTVGAFQLGLVFFGWGLCLALSSVFLAPALTRRLGRGIVLTAGAALLALILVALALFVHDFAALVALIVVSGLVSGVMNTVLTEAVMESTRLPRAVASSTYSGVRFLGGAISSALAGLIAASFGPAVPYWVSAAAFVVSAAILFARRSHLDAINREAEGLELPE